ncbi:hypothetical protein I3271_07550 [Photobacterium leiognathi]|uniref:SAM-dependent methyltransferase n=1 Tax=Photobacterium leiognathi TaxID=553611 RepID=UPI001EE147FE|nr:SAM-dependent methyltransferase [Photobacterium leiognathi]MCG3884541.1 hypothetical protein [Photobacterium leiognathi]
MHSGLYPSNEDIINEKEFEEAAIKLTHVLSELMIRHGESDPLSRLLSDFTTNSKDLSYFPTPDGVTKLISALLGEEKLNSGNKHSMYEPTAGSGAIILQRMEDHFYANQHLDNPLEGVSILTEDISDLMCNSLFLQLVHKLQYLSSLAGRQVFPDQVRIASVDVLSRKKGRVYYEMSKYQ